MAARAWGAWGRSGPEAQARQGGEIRASDILDPRGAACGAGAAHPAPRGERQQPLCFDRLLSARSTLWLRATGRVLLCLGAAVRGWGWGWGWSLALVAYSGHTSLAAGWAYLGLILGARRAPF